MNIRNFFLEKFYNFLTEEREFFEKYKKNYVINLLQILKRNYPQIKLTKDIKNNFINFYNALFINPALKTGQFYPLIEIKDFFSQKRIENNILNKSFLLLTNSYIKHIFSQSDINKLKTLVLLLDFYYKFLDTQIEKEILPNKIPHLLEEIYYNKTPIILFGVYKGIPISHKSHILSINKKENTICVSANNYQIIASKFQKEIYILDTKTNNTFKAFVEEIIKYKKRLRLSNIQQIKRNILKRNYIRVQPKEKLKAIIIIDKNSFEGEIYDISIKGVSIITKESIPLNISETALIKFKLPIKEKIYSFTAELRSISKFDEKYRYHFYFEPTPIEEKELEKYITKREQEIINELNKYLNQEFIDLKE